MMNYDRRRTSRRHYYGRAALLLAVIFAGQFGKVPSDEPLAFAVVFVCLLAAGGIFVWLGV